MSAKLLLPDCCVTTGELQLDFELPPTNTAPELTGQVPPGFAGLTALRRWALPRMNLQVCLRLLPCRTLLNRLILQRRHAMHAAASLHWLSPGMPVGCRGPWRDVHPDP